VSGDAGAPTLADAGFVERREGTIASEHAALLAATLDAGPDILASGTLPTPWHWACFLPDAPTATLGPDGHPARRPAMAPFANRMWIGGLVEAPTPLHLDRHAVRTSALVHAEHKRGTTGEFWLLQVEHRITQDGVLRVQERQDIALRAPSATSPPGADAEPPIATWVHALTASPPLLFRFSALTFNTHRIHYDHPYATAVEGYPDLVVQGPLTATLLADLAQRHLRRRVAALDFRARAPLFANQRFFLVGDPTERGASSRAVRGDGTTAMTCEVIAAEDP
jgi:3-methylfumaryl-CoA hydratase